MKFWDASAIVPLLFQEERTIRSQKWFSSEHEMIVWHYTMLECWSAAQRKYREKRIVMSDLPVISDRLQDMQNDWIEVGPDPGIRDRAVRLLAVHPLRAADALQLAAALVAFDERPSGNYFLTHDSNLGSAARREGFLVPE